METPATDPAPAPAPNPPAKPGRKPLDAAGRDAAAQRSIARKMAKKLASAKNTEEFWSLAEDLAEKGGRKPVKVAGEKTEEKPAGPDPLDVPIAPSWPTPRQMAEVAPGVTVAVGALADALEDTRYDALSHPITVSGPDNEQITIDRKAILIKPLTACAALIAGGKTPDLHPGWALVLATAFVFGPPAVMHAAEVFGPRVSAWWSGGKKPEAAPARAVASEEAPAAPRLVKRKEGTS